MRTGDNRIGPDNGVVPRSHARLRLNRVAAQQLARLCKNSVESLDDLFFAPPLCAISKKTWDSDAKKARVVGIRPTINLSAGVFHSLSLERTQPQRDFMYDVAELRRSARGR